MEVRTTLVVGIIASAILLLIGFALDVVRGTTDLLAVPSRFAYGGLLGDLAGGDGSAYIVVGVLVLVFTPLVRVLVSFAHFAATRDRAFTLITAFVLAVLAASVVIGVSP
jgi:uncharacterized membrane protein